MITPSLTNFADFVEKPKPVISKSPKQVQQDVNWYLNIFVIMIIVTGSIYLYQRFKTKTQREKETKHKLQQFDTYLNEHYINDMLAKSK